MDNSHEYSLCITKTRGVIHDDSFHSDHGGKISYMSGHVTTPYGYVMIYSDHRISTLKFMMPRTKKHEGREYTRVYNRSFSKRGLAILATRFAKYLTQDNSHGQC